MDVAAQGSQGGPLGTRPRTVEDEVLLRELYSSVFGRDVGGLGYEGAPSREVLEDLQFRAREAGYRASYPEADDLVVLWNGASVGRLLIDRSGSELRVVDVVLLPAARGQGIGGAAMGSVQREARSSGRPVRISVLRDNPARRLWERLGFRVVADDGEQPHVAMEWVPEA